MRDRFRDPRGWLLDKSPWWFRRRYIARSMRVPVAEVPDGARYIGMRRPAQEVIEWGRKLAAEYGWDDSRMGQLHHPRCVLPRDHDGGCEIADIYGGV